jgi:hypothetical protein
MSTEPTSPGSIERGRAIAESMMDHATAEYRQRLAEERSGMPRPPAVEPVEPLSSSVGGTGSRTGGLKAQGSAQASDLLDVVRDTHTQCDCDECLGKIAAAVLKAAAGSLCQLGHVAAADRLASTAKDLTEGATS